jgi:outer membrane protein, heavy metal efflux system
VISTAGDDWSVFEIGQVNGNPKMESGPGRRTDWGRRFMAYRSNRFASQVAFRSLAIIASLLTAAAPTAAASGKTLPAGQMNWSGAPLVSPSRAGAVAALPETSPARSSAAGAADLEHSPSLEAVQRYGAAHNPAIRAAFYAWQAAQRRITQARSYQNPMVTYMPDTGNMAETRAGPQTNGFGISQAIPFPGKLALSGRIADQQAQAARENLAAVMQETMRRIRRAYAQFYFAERALEVNAESAVLARQFENVAETKFKVGKVPEEDVIQGQEEISRLATERVDFAAQRNTAIGTLNTLLDREPRAPLGRPMEMATAELKVPLAQLINEAGGSRPEIRAENHLVEAREQSVTLAKMGYLPDFSIGGQYIGIDGHMGVPGFSRDGHDIWAATIGMSVPIWIDRVKARVDETGAQLQEENFTRRNVEDMVNDQIQDAYERLTAAARNDLIYRTTLLAQTAERIRAAQAGYQTGTVDFLTLIDSLKSYENVRLLDYQTVRAYHDAAADLSRAVGKSISGIVK